MLKNGKKRPQLRRCALCEKPGHNQKTCPIFLSKNNQTKSATAKQTVHFFIHHTAGEPNHSPHLIDLKNKKINVWQEVQAIAPTEYTDAIHNFYHTPGQPITTPTLKIKPINIIKTNDAVDTPQPITQPKKLWQNRFGSFAAKQVKFTINFGQNLFNSSLDVIKDKFSLVRLSKVTAFVFLIIILPTQVNSYYFNVKKTANLVIAESTIGFVSLQDATGAILNADLPAAANSLYTALEKFNNAADTLNSKHEWLLKIAAGIPFLKGQVASKQNILLAGQKIALGNIYFLKGISSSQSAGDQTILDRFNIFTVHLRASLPNYEQALKLLARVNSESLPLEYQASFKDFYKLFTALVRDMRNLAELGENINEIFGGHGLRRYLLVFQNHNELRPTGGFIGSFAILDIKDGKIINLEIPAGGSYDLQGQLTTDILPPAPLLLSNNRWEFQDANWFPDFSASAEKLLWFYRKSRNVTADGVIAINATALERLLGIVGPITDEKRGVVLTSANALTTIQQIVETGPEKIYNKPKQIISDLAPKFINHLQNSDPKNILPLISNLKAALDEKEIQAYFTDQTTENTIQSFGWGGQIIPTIANQDYLMAVNANIQGQKSDARIKQSISHQTVVQDDGSMINSVVITREHTGENKEAMYGQTNIDYFRLYVPADSELISAGGFTWPNENQFKAAKATATEDTFLDNIEEEIKYDENSGTRITNEFGKTAFGNWIITEPGQTSQIQFIYKLPFKAFTTKKNTQNKLAAIFSNNKNISKYQLIVQKQSGLETQFESQIIFPTGWQPEWKNGENITLAANGAAIHEQILATDSVWSMAMAQ